jgi:diguanylate cyclase (GGDEF)-like protein
VSDAAVQQPLRPKVLLVGDPSARPAGLERALTRAGFQLVEQGDEAPEAAADAILVTLKELGAEGWDELFPGPNSNTGTNPPRIVILETSDPDAPAAALGRGAVDALAAPVHLPELCARLHARIRERQGPEAATLEPERPEVGGNARLQEPPGVEALDRRVQEEFERARRYSLSFSLVLLGVDEVAAVNQRLGPEARERRRDEVGSVLRRELRLPDFVTPYGDDEFAIVLPETDQSGARQSVIRIRERLTAVQSDGDPRSEQPRFSAGIVTYPHPAAAQTDDLFALVEAALMRGKAQTVERIAVAT